MKELKKRPDAEAETEAAAQEEAEASKGQTLLQHALALRKALLISLAAIGIGFVLIFYFAINPLMKWITSPIESRGVVVIYTAISEALVTQFKVALIAGVIVASPIVFWQLWEFVKPALYENEKRAARLIFFIALGLFLLGVAFAYVAIYNLAIDFFLIAGDNIATPMLSLDKYVGFLFGFLIPFGLAFELPIAIWFTTKMGWTTAEGMAKKRKYILLAIFIVAAILTPPDVVSQVALGVPLYLLYEVSILIARRVKPRDPFAEDETEQTKA